MSFLNAGRAIQRFLYDQRYNTPYFEGLAAVLFARRFNTTIREENDDFLNGPGKLRQLKVSYYPQECDVVDEDTSTINVCATGTVAQPIQNYYTIERLKKSKRKTLYPDDLRLVDGQEATITNHAIVQIAAMFGALEKSLAIDVVSDVVAHAGVHLDGSEFGQRVQFANTTNGQLNITGLNQIEMEQISGAFSNTFIIGYTEVYYWQKAIGIAAPNTTLGQDFTKLAQRNLYWDVNLNTIMGFGPTDPEMMVTFDPQALKFVSWNRNAGMFATDSMGVQDFERIFKSGTAQVIRGTFKSPKYDLLWDFYANYEPCVEGSYTGHWNWHFELNWDILYTPIQTCNGQGVNGIMIYRTCPVVVPACPEGTALSPAVPTSTFSYDPNFTYPLLVSQLTLSGQASYPNVTVANDTELVALFNSSISGVTFSLSGANIQYTGWSAIAGNINGTSFNFA